MFSLSGSSNLTAFLVVVVVVVFLEAAVLAVDGAAVLVARVARLAVVSVGLLAVVACSAAALRARALAAKEDVVGCFTGSVESFFFFLGCSVDDRDAVAASVNVFFLGLLRCLLAPSSSSSVSSALVLRFATVLLVPEVAVEGGGGATFALAAAVMILAVFIPESVALAAARARVIRLGGESMVVIKKVYFGRFGVSR